MCAPDGSTIVASPTPARAAALAAYPRTGGARRSRSCIPTRPTRSAPTAWRGPRPATASSSAAGSPRSRPCPTSRAAIVVDDADEALQEERVAHLARARRAARARGARRRPWTVVSPAPTVEAVVAIDAPLEAPPPDVERGGWPRGQVVDRREEPPGAGLLTEALADALRDADGLAVCVLNRRGRFRLLACDACHAPPAVGPCRRAAAACATSAARRKLRVLRAGVAPRRRGAGGAVPGSASSTSTPPPRGPRRRHPDRHGSGAAPARDPPAAARAGRVPRPRPGAARAALPRRRAGALARRPAARSCSPAGRGDETLLLRADAPARPRGRPARS